MQKMVDNGQAPKDIKQFHKGGKAYDGQKDHVHFKDGTSLNYDGTIHDKKGGTPNHPKKTSKWLEDHGWAGSVY